VNAVLAAQLLDWQKGATKRAVERYIAADHKPGELKPDGYGKRLREDRPAQLVLHRDEGDDKRLAEFKGKAARPNRSYGSGNHVGHADPKPLSYWRALRESWGFLRDNNVQTMPLHNLSTEQGGIRTRPARKAA